MINPNLLLRAATIFLILSACHTTKSSNSGSVTSEDGHKMPQVFEKVGYLCSPEKPAKDRWTIAVDRGYVFLFEDRDREAVRYFLHMSFKIESEEKKDKHLYKAQEEDMKMEIATDKDKKKLRGKFKMAKNEYDIECESNTRVEYLMH